MKNGIFRCNGRCSCRRSTQHCTELSKCKGLCKWWDNTDEIDIVLDPIDEEEEHDEPESVNHAGLDDEDVDECDK